MHGVDPLDQALCRAHEIFLDDGSEVADAELRDLLPALVAAGYIDVDREWGDDGEFLWGFTASGVARGEELGCL